MIVLEKSSNLKMPVYAVYWVDGVRHYWVLREGTYKGLMVLRENECVLLDPCFSNDFSLLKMDEERDMIVHWAVQDLATKLFDNEESAFIELQNRLTNN